MSLKQTDVYKPTRSEADVQSSVILLLKSLGILAFRLNVGAMVKVYKGRRSYVRFGVSGMADILAFVKVGESRTPSPVWIECKSSSGKLSKDQKTFRQLVEADGHAYLVVRSADELHKLIEIGTYSSQRLSN